MSEQPKICLQKLDYQISYYQPSRPCHHSQCVRAAQHMSTETVLIILTIYTMSSVIVSEHPKICLQKLDYQISYYQPSRPCHQSLCQSSPTYVFRNHTNNTNHPYHVISHCVRAPQDMSAETILIILTIYIMSSVIVSEHPKIDCICIQKLYLYYKPCWSCHQSLCHTTA